MSLSEGIVIMRANCKPKEHMRRLGFRNSRSYAEALLGFLEHCPECGEKLTWESETVRCICGWSKPCINGIIDWDHGMESKEEESCVGL